MQDAVLLVVCGLFSMIKNSLIPKQQAELFNAVKPVLMWVQDLDISSL